MKIELSTENTEAHREKITIMTVRRFRRLAQIKEGSDQFEFRHWLFGLNLMN